LTVKGVRIAASGLPVTINDQPQTLNLPSYRTSGVPVSAAILASIAFAQIS
jgi:hypothetical protein